MLTVILTLIMVLVTMDIMVTGRGFRVTGVGDGRTTGGEESGTRDIGGTTVKFNFSRLTRDLSLGFNGVVY